jgi:hypothetical protein
MTPSRAPLLPHNRGPAQAADLDAIDIAIKRGCANARSLERAQFKRKYKSDNMPNAALRRCWRTAVRR